VLEVSRPGGVPAGSGASLIRSTLRPPPAVLAGTATAEPQRHDGIVEAVRMLRGVPSGAVKARTAAVNQLKALWSPHPHRCGRRWMGCRLHLLTCWPCAPRVGRPSYRHPPEWPSRRNADAPVSWGTQRRNLAVPPDVADGMTKARNRLAVDFQSKYGRPLRPGGPLLWDPDAPVPTPLSAAKIEAMFVQTAELMGVVQATIYAVQ
jgi:hypothetical protein